MPFSLTFTISMPEQNLPENCVPALHATFFQWLERGDTDIARRVHNVSDSKPYTVSPLTREEDTARFRITLLDDTLWAPLKLGVESKPEIHVLWATMSLIGEPHIEQTSYVALAQNAGNESTITLQFDSPTSFKSNAMHYPLPDPMMVFESYRARWNAFAPQALQISDEWADWLRQSVAVARAEIVTQNVQFKDYQQIGFVGVVEYTVVNRAPDREGRGPLNALADYAYFCGTGHKTTQGMGQTRRLVEWANPR